jgi:glycosyltransferase involved in cell wall biosynthesis
LSGEENLAYVGRPLVTRIRAGHEYQDRQSYFKLLSLAQIVSFNPATYSEDLIAWANQAASRPSATLSYVFAVDQPLSAFPLLQKIAKSLARAGEVVTVVGPSEQRMSVKDGIQYLALEGLNSEAIGQYINQLGDQLVLVGVDSVSLLVGFRATPNVVGRVLFDTGSNLIESVDTYSAIDCVVSESSRRSDWLTQGFNLSQVIVNEDSQPDSFSTSLSLFMEPQAQCQEVEYLTALQQMPCFDCGEAGKLHTRALRFAIKRLDVRARQAAVLENLRCLSDYSLAEETADPTMFSIVIPCRNVDILRLRRNLNSLRSQKTFTDLEIVLSDFGSNEKHAALLQQLASEFDCVVARTETRGPWSRSAALNQGIRTATRKWIATTDADMIFSNDFFQMVYCYLSSLGERSIFYAQPIKLPPLDLPLDWQSGDYAEVAAKGRVFGEQGRGGCQIVLRSWLEQVRGFNEAYLVWGNEDDDMFDRAGWAGLNRFWLKPGRYLHQWHMPNIYQAARDENRAQHQALRASPRIVVNDESWGLQKADTEELIKKNPPTSGRSISELQDEIIARAQDTKAQAALLAQHGRQALQNGQLDAALELLEDSVHLSSKDPSVLLSLAETYIKIGQIEFAVVNIDRALELQPSFEPAHRAREVLRTV